MENKNNEINEILKYKIKNSLKTIGLPYLDIKDSGEYVILSFPKFKSYMNKQNYIRTLQETFKEEIENYVKNIRNT